MPNTNHNPFIINACNFACLNKQNLLIYYPSKDKPINLQSFSEALKPNNYRCLTQPFSYVIIDKLTSECLLVRDHLGVRPLYYYHQKDKLIFGDNIKDIFQLLPNTPELLAKEIVNLFKSINFYSDNTLYKNIYRVEPGHMIYINTKQTLVKSAFWELSRYGETLYYPNDSDYLEHFSEIFKEAIKNATQGVSSVAAEFSAGMDSTAIYGTCVSLGLNPTLFMHESAPELNNKKLNHKYYEKEVFDKYPPTNLYRLKPENFDAIGVFKKYANWFAGPPAYVFELFAQPLHSAVAATKHQILLSGFGGDQGVSSHIPSRFILPELISNKKLRNAWEELKTKKFLLRLILLAQYSNPYLYQIIQGIKDLNIASKNLFTKNDRINTKNNYPYYRDYFHTLRDAEWSFLQGPNSHEIRMRIEYSSIVAKNMGFEYRYPLLYPKLLEFFISLPITQKRRQGLGRLLMRRYLASIFPTSSFNNYKKTEGLNIIPTLDVFKVDWESKIFRTYFANLPYTNLIQDKSLHIKIIKSIQALMLKEFLMKNK